MRSITCNIDELQSHIAENRDQHRAIFDEACQKYKERCLELLEEKMHAVKAGKLENVAISLPIPEDHTTDYDRIIQMLELHTETTIELEEEDVAQYVMDDWSWKRHWLASTASYTSG